MLVEQARSEQVRGITHVAGLAAKVSRESSCALTRLDDEWQLMLARYHVSSFGRFTSVDPTRESVNLENPATWNRYSYSRNSPINRFDPDGRADRSTMDMDRRSGAWAHAGGLQNEGTGARLLRYAVTGGLGLFLAPVAVLAVEASPTLSFAVQNPVNHLAAYEMVAAATDNPSVLRGAGAALSLADDAARGIRFGQQGVSATFRHGEFAGRTIEEVAAGLRSGAISPNQLPIQTITRNGIEYTLNNRSLMALREAGLDPTVVQNVTGKAFFEQQLTQRLIEMGGAVPPDFVPIVRGR